MDMEGSFWLWFAIVASEPWKLNPVAILLPGEIDKRAAVDEIGVEDAS